MVESWEIEDVDGVVPLPGAVELLASLPGDLWTIVTSCTRDLAAARFRAAGLKVPQSIVTATDIVRGKPDPEPYLKGAALLGLSASRCLVFEDVTAGIQSGHAAGARVVGLATTLSREALLSAGADWILASCAEVCVAGRNPLTLAFLS